MIERLKIENFKVFKEVEIPLQPLTVIVGPNASGKTTILQALEWLCHNQDGQPLSGVTDFPRHGSATFSLEPEVIDPATKKAHAWKYSVTVSEDGGIKTTTERLLDGQPAEEPTPERVSRSFRGRRLLFQTTKLAAPSYFHPDYLPPRLSDDGSGLASVIANLKLEHEEKFQRLIEQLRFVIPVVEGARTPTATVVLNEPDAYLNGALRPNKYTGNELVLDIHGARAVRASQVSEGTLLTIGLLAVLNGLNPPNLLLIDDIERGLHPSAMGKLIGQLRRLQEQNPDLQIVATSHSPYFLDYLEHKEILLTNLNEDGSASVAPLTEHPDFERWKDLLEPGEYWATAGEGWVPKVQEAEKS